MSQNSLAITTTPPLSGLALVAAINNALNTLGTLNSGAAAPGTTIANMLWLNTTLLSLARRNNANSAWEYPFDGKGADIASAGTINLDTATGKCVDVTGTTGITAVTLREGQQKLVRFTGILTLTNGASLILPTSANITTAAGDYAIFQGYATGVVRVMYFRFSGTAVAASSIADHTLTPVMKADAFDGFSFSNLTIIATVGSNNLDVSIKTKAGGNPSATDVVRIPFRNATDATGDYSVLEIAAANTIQAAAGASFGVSNNSPFRLWVGVFNDGGTARLLLTNCLVGGNSPSRVYGLDEGSVASGTQISSGSTAAATLYTTAAVTSKAFRIIGYLEWSSGLATAGTFASAPTKIQLFGPGQRKPGDVVQRVRAATGTQTSTTSSTFQTTGVAATITMSSAANIIRGMAMGNLASGNAATNAIVSIFRDATDLVMNMTANGGGGAAYAGINLGFWDKPNDASAHTYTSKLKSSDNANTVYFPATTSSLTYGAMDLEEVMT